MKDFDDSSALEKAFKEVELYMVQNSEGQFFRAKGYRGYGASWVDNPATARIYVRIGAAISQVSYFASHFPDFPAPTILRLSIGRIVVLDESDRVRKILEKNVSKAKKAYDISSKAPPPPSGYNWRYSGSSQERRLKDLAQHEKALAAFVEREKK